MACRAGTLRLVDRPEVLHVVLRGKFGEVVESRHRFLRRKRRDRVETDREDLFPVLQHQEHLPHLLELHLPPEDVGLPPFPDREHLRGNLHDLIEDGADLAHHIRLRTHGGQLRVGHLDVRAEHVPHLRQVEFRLLLLLLDDPDRVCPLPRVGNHLGEADLLPRHILLAERPGPDRDVGDRDPPLGIVQRPRADRLVLLHRDPLPHGRQRRVARKRRVDVIPYRSRRLLRPERTRPRQRDRDRQEEVEDSSRCHVSFADPHRSSFHPLIFLSTIRPGIFASPLLSDCEEKNPYKIKQFIRIRANLHYISLPGVRRRAAAASGLGRSRRGPAIRPEGTGSSQEQRRRHRQDDRHENGEHPPFPTGPTPALHGMRTPRCGRIRRLMWSS